MAYDETLRNGDHVLAAQALEPVKAAAVVRIRNGRVVVTDGPFAETNEQVGGFILIEARDMNEALRLASGIPAIHLGGIEVRPVKELSAAVDRRRRSSEGLTLESDGSLTPADLPN
jgi:hypothetical protein